MHSGNILPEGGVAREAPSSGFLRDAEHGSRRGTGSAQRLRDARLKRAGPSGNVT